MNQIRKLRLQTGALILATGMLLLPSLVSAQTPPQGEMKTKTLLDYYSDGGAFMHPILLCSVGTAAVVVFCFIQLSAAKMMPKSQAETLTHFMKEKDPGSAYEMCLNNPNTLTNTMAAALLKVNFERELANKISMEQSASETLMLEENRYMGWVNYLNVFATIAPMLGLLGTVTGMIASFDVLAAGRSEPKDLAGGIGEAMITTAGGLIVGIPAMFFYFYFRNKLISIMGNVQRTVSFLIDVISGELKLAGAVEPQRAELAPDVEPVQA